MVWETLVDYIAQHFEIDKEDITKETTFEEIRAHEEDIVDMLFEMSRKFDFVADEDDLYGIEDVGTLADLISNLSRE
ncbi:MAG: hypothetical protein IJI67_05215 [Clostridia bacterium]|nr:hypothetical protein [Clostridia bacterium]